jgi:phospholipid transport system transporter-binding protein
VTRLEGEHLILTGDLTVATVPALLAAGDERFEGDFSSVDFAAVGQVDSAAVALALDWLRAAHAAGRSLTFLHLPPAMLKLARLYGVADFLLQQP